MTPPKGPLTPPIAPSQPPGPDWQEVLAFVQSQAKSDRESFQYMLNRALLFLALAGAVVIGLVHWTLGQTREEAKALVRERVNGEFDTPRIRETLSDVAKRKYSEELQRLMAAEIQRQVAVELQRQIPFIQKAIIAETARQLKRRAAPRVLDQTLRRDLVAVLKKRPPVRFEIECVGSSDSEACGYASQYLAIFHEAGWKAVQMKPVPPPNKRFWDVAILVRDAQHPPATATALEAALEEAWPEATFPLESDPATTSDVPRLLIPPKPY